MEDTSHLVDLLDDLESEALGADQCVDPSIVHLLFRGVHNLKSGLAMAGLAELSAEFHVLEDGLDRIRRGREVWSPEWEERLLKVVDSARSGMGARSVVPASAPSRPLETRKKSQASRWGLSLDASQLAAIDAAQAQGWGVYRIEKMFRSGLSREAFEGLPVMADVQEQGTLVALSPDWAEYAAGPTDQVVRILFVSSQSLNQLGDVFFDPIIELKAPNMISPASPIPETLRILVVEDDATSGFLLKYILQQHGACSLATSGRDGFLQWYRAVEQKSPFQMVVLDLRMPDFDGTELLRLVREIEFEQGIPIDSRCLVVVNSSSDALVDIHRSLFLEADGYLQKPISLDAIQAKIAQLKDRLAQGNTAFHSDPPDPSGMDA